MAASSSVGPHTPPSASPLDANPEASKSPKSLFCPDLKIEKLVNKATALIQADYDAAKHKEFHEKFKKWDPHLPNLQNALEGGLDEEQKIRLRILLAPPQTPDPAAAHAPASASDPDDQTSGPALPHGAGGATPNREASTPLTPQELQEASEQKAREKSERTTKRVALVGGLLLFAVGVAISATGWGAIAGVPLALIGLGIAIYFNKEEFAKYGLIAGKAIAEGSKAVGKGAVGAGKAVVNAPGRIWERISKVLEKDKAAAKPPSDTAAAKKATTITATVEEPGDPELEQNTKILAKLIEDQLQPNEDAISNLQERLRQNSKSDLTVPTTGDQQERKSIDLTETGKKILKYEAALTALKTNLALVKELGNLDAESVQNKLSNGMWPLEAALTLSSMPAIGHKTEVIEAIVERLLHLGATKDQVPQNPTPKQDDLLMRVRAKSISSEDSL